MTGGDRLGGVPTALVRHSHSENVPEPSRHALSEADVTALRADLLSRQPSAFMRVYDRCVAGVYPLALELVGRVEVAEAVIEDVFLALWRNPDEALSAPTGLHQYLAESECDGARCLIATGRDRAPVTAVRPSRSAPLHTRARATRSPAGTTPMYARRS